MTHDWCQLATFRPSKYIHKLASFQVLEQLLESMHAVYIMVRVNNHEGNGPNNSASLSVASRDADACISGTKNTWKSCLRIETKMTSSGNS